MPTTNIDKRVARIVELTTEETNALKKVGIVNEDDLSYMVFDDFAPTISKAKRRKLEVISKFLLYGETLDSQTDMGTIQIFVQNRDNPNDNPSKQTVTIEQMSKMLQTLKTDINEIHEMMVKDKTEQKSFTAANTAFVDELLLGYGMRSEHMDSNQEQGTGDPVGNFSWVLPVEDGGNAKLSEPDGMEAASNWIKSKMTNGLCVDNQPIGFKDTKGQSLYTLHANHKEASGKSDGCVASASNIELCDRTYENLYLYGMGLVEVKTDGSPIKKTQMNLQLATMSLQSIYKQSVVLLGTDCNLKWYLAHFEKRNMIQVQQYAHGRKCLDDFEALLVSIDSRYETLEAAKPKRHVSEHAEEQDLSGFDEAPATGLVAPTGSGQAPTGSDQAAVDKALDNEAFLHAFANYLAKSPLGDGERPTIPEWALAKNNVPSYYMEE